MIDMRFLLYNREGNSFSTIYIKDGATFSLVYQKLDPL